MSRTTTIILVAVLSVGAALAILMALGSANQQATAFRAADAPSSFVAPTPAGLRGVVVAKGWQCEDQPSSPELTVVDRYPLTSTWRLRCPFGFTYLVTLGEDGDVLTVRRDGQF